MLALRRSENPECPHVTATGNTSPACSAGSRVQSRSGAPPLVIGEPRLPADADFAIRRVVAPTTVCRALKSGLCRTAIPVPTGPRCSSAMPPRVKPAHLATSPDYARDLTSTWLLTGIEQGPLVFGMDRDSDEAHDEGSSLVVMTTPLKGFLVVCVSRTKINETETVPSPCLPAGAAAALDSLPVTPSASAARYKRSQG